MKELFENLGLADLFAYLCPGAITLLSFAFWTTPNLASILGTELAKNEFVVAVVFLLASYAVGLIVAAWSGEGAALYDRNRARRIAGYSMSPVLWFVWLLHWIPRPKQSRETVEGNLRIQEGLDSYGGFPGLTQFLSSWDRPATYRVVILDQFPEAGKLMLKEADSATRRRLFALGVALAVMLLVIQAFARLLLMWMAHIGATAFLFGWVSVLPLGRPEALWAIVILGLLVSFALRRAAGRFWEYELLLTCSLQPEAKKNGKTNDADKGGYSIARSGPHFRHVRTIELHMD
jgi:hypothetical protein